MGWIRHHSILVTATYGDWAEKAHREAQDLFPNHMLSPLSEEGVNGTRSFAVFPDGSKEGWQTSHRGDAARDIFIEWLRSQMYDDGSTPLSWAEVQYGDDGLETEVVRSSDHDQQKRKTTP